MSNRSPWSRCAPLAWLLAVALLGLPAAAVAQTDVTTTRASGVVSGPDGGALPGVRVEVKNEETGAVTTVYTDERGFYRALNLPSGLYTFTATLESFTTASRENVRLQLGSTPTINFALQLATVSEEILVTGDRPAVEVTNTSNQTLFETEQIARIPQNNRDIKNLATLAPQASIEGERRNLALSGQRGINTNVTIDGVDFNNAFFGGTVGTAEGRAPLSISVESIKEFSVITNGASVEFGRSGGGFVNVVTKSGTNNLRGSLFYYNQPQSLISDFANGVEPADQEREQFGGSIGGPITSDRLFYFVSYDEQTKSTTVPISSRVLDAEVFAKYPELVSGPTYEQTEDGNVLFGRLDFLANPSHRFMLRGNFTEYEGVNGTSGSTTQTESRNGVEGLDTTAFVGSWSGTFGSSWINDLNVNYIEEDTPRADKGLDLPDFQVSGLGNYGEVSFLPIVSTTERKAFGDTLSYIRGDHLFKAGVEYNDTSIDQIFKGNWRGVFIFNSKADFLAGQWSQYRQFGGLGGLTADEAGNANFGQEEFAIFLQDQWFYSPNLTFSFGVRLESLDNPNDPILNANDRNANGTFRLTGSVPDMDLTDQISPRFGMSWSPGDDQRTAVRFAAGRYWSRTPAILLAQLYTSNGLRGTQYQIRATPPAAPTDPLAPGWGPAFTVAGTERIDFTQVTNISAPGVFTIDPGFENPYTDRFTVNVEREVMPLLVAGVDVTYAKSKQLQRLTDLNLAYSGALAANGLPAYGARPNSAYGQVITSVSDAESEYTSVGLSLRRRLRDGIQYSVSVAWSEDEDNDSNERNFSGIQAEDTANLGLNKGPSNRDQEWRAGASALWETPWWGISLSGSARFSTGSPWNITTGSDTNGNGVFTDRPTVNGVHVGRNTERQPDFKQLDLRVAKALQFDRVGVTLFAECYNCTDEANWTVPGNNMTWGSANLPAPTSASFGDATTPGTLPRTIQFGLRFDLD
ncbi:MAG: carboxypeptidase regulatory-like domain-containing protein [Thermoanaerobaculia bacterium]|nr:carboxypeptidase regulatory-like domain-containing protein [Thermoanaerobaculia bacterium]